jgi:RsiW-degrading membrane proteinase PrsW (M82 family)
MLFYYHELRYYGDQIVILQAESFLQLLATQYNVIELDSVFSLIFHSIQVRCTTLYTNADIYVIRSRVFLV